jgi:transposase
MHCIGVDVSKQELVTYDGAAERVFTNAPGLRSFRRFVNSLPDVIVVFEPTSTYSRRLETLCRTDNIACCLLNPRVLPHYRQVGKGRSKTDKTDAKLLYRYGIERGQEEAGQLTHDALAQGVVARLACHRVVQKARVACQGLLDALDHDPATEKDLLAELRREIAELKARETRQLEDAQAAVAADDDAARRFAMLLSIPGIGPMTALILLALFRKYPDVNRRQLVALSGLDPIQVQSGTSVHGKSRISKRGSREVRKCLFEATLSAARYNPSIRTLYRRLKDAGKPDKVARIAAARKLLLLAHAIYESGEEFRAPAEEVT